MVQYRNVGHHGPAVEDAGAAYRIYFNDSGAIDLYSKSGEQMELRKYLWYPTERQQAEEALRRESDGELDSVRLKKRELAEALARKLLEEEAET